MYNCNDGAAEVSQDTRLEVTPDTGLGTFPSNPLSRPIFKPNLIAYCVTGTGHTIGREVGTPNPDNGGWLCLVRASYNQQSPRSQVSSRHHQPSSPGFALIGTRRPCNCIKECREIRTTSAPSTRHLGPSL